MSRPLRRVWRRRRDQFSPRRAAGSFVVCRVLSVEGFPVQYLTFEGKWWCDGLGGAHAHVWSRPPSVGRVDGAFDEVLARGLVAVVPYGIVNPVTGEARCFPVWQLLREEPVFCLSLVDGWMLMLSFDGSCWLTGGDVARMSDVEMRQAFGDEATVNVARDFVSLQATCRRLREEAGLGPIGWRDEV